MKPLLRPFFALALLFLSVAAAAAFNVEGYLLRAEGDTVHCVLSVPGQIAPILGPQINFDKAELRILRYDSVSNEGIPFTPKDIAGWGFTYRKWSFHFRVKPMANGEWRFLRRVLAGKEVNIYTHSEVVDPTFGPSTWVNGQVTGGGSPGGITRHYTIERADSTRLFAVEATGAKKLKAAVKERFADVAGIKDLLWGRFLNGSNMHEDILYVFGKINDPSLPTIIPRNGM